jgi:hypothetical protein
MTFKDLEGLGHSAKDEMRHNAFMQSYNIKSSHPYAEKSDYNGANIGVFFNFGENVYEWLDYGGVTPEMVTLDREFVFPVPLNEGTCEYDEANQKCIYANPTIWISGKVLYAETRGGGVDGESLNIFIRPIGVSMQ